MALARAQVVIPFKTNLPQDVITNSFYFEGTGTSSDLADQATNCTPILEDFYVAAYAGGTVAANYVNWAGATVRWYDLAQPEPRVPIVLPFDIATIGTSGSTLPTEVSVVASFHAAPVPGANARRRRGRVYLGGWSSPIVTSVANQPPMLQNVVATNIVESMEALMLAGQAIDNIWSVYSPTSSTVGPLFVPVAGGWVDNTLDTQRRRGVAASSRLVWP